MRKLHRLWELSTAHRHSSVESLAPDPKVAVAIRLKDVRQVSSCSGARIQARYVTSEFLEVEVISKAKRGGRNRYRGNFDVDVASFIGEVSGSRSDRPSIESA